jgi:hypothetical protein
VEHHGDRLSSSRGGRRPQYFWWKYEYTVSFVSNHEPVWGNFYAKDGVGGGSDHLTDPTVVWNDGITLTTP